MPTGQRVHDAEPGVENEPAGHDVHAPAPAEEEYPAEQLLHTDAVVAPVAPLAVPAGQLTQLALPALL